MKELFFRFAAWFNLFPCPLCRTGDGGGRNRICPECRKGVPGVRRAALSGLRRHAGRTDGGLRQMPGRGEAPVGRGADAVRIPGSGPADAA